MALCLPMSVHGTKAGQLGLEGGFSPVSIQFSFQAFCKGSNSKQEGGDHRRVELAFRVDMQH